ncbi:cadherin repeat domain-containing protein [Bradyrhizobium sp. 147]|uniref:cadherin repeat domain-containing protein n=1 Tax=Bradyrhizobium sp. 147 TaxID=2782623 RepID=UPI001FFA4BAD|nr:cadherin repeat domain-containing protein [Bradyrhizobium sp. 147]MCK1679541.1 cadherin repeat domain-containing protein [Bradyrhizobium sp. 147]
MRFGVGVRFPVPGMISLVGKAFSRSRVKAASSGTTPLSGKATARWSWRSGLGSVPVITSTSFTLGTNPGFDALIGHVDATNNPTSYAITAGNPSGFFALYPSGNMRTGLSAAPPDNIYNLTVTASNSFGTSPPKAITVTVGAAPVVGNSTFNLSIPAAAGTAVGTMSASGGTPTSWAITAGNSSGYFAIDNSGLITVTSAGASGLTAQTYNLTVRATNALGSNTGTVSVVATTGGSVDDGFANAPTGSAQYPSFFGGYPARPPWHVAGVDYRVGPNTGTVFKNPRTAALPSGVTRDVAGQQFNVTANDVTLDAWDFTEGGGWRLAVTGSNCTVTNSKFKARAGTYDVISCSGTNLVLRYCDVDGRDGSNALQAEVLLQMFANNFTIEYSYFHHVNSDIIQQSNGNLGDITIRWSLFEQSGQAPGTHGDFLQIYNPDMRNVVLQFVTSIQVGGSTQGWILDNIQTADVGYCIVKGSCSNWYSWYNQGRPYSVSFHHNWSDYSDTASFIDFNSTSGLVYGAAPTGPPIVDWHDNYNLDTGQLMPANMGG